MWIGNRILAVELHRFQQHFVTSNPKFNITIFLTAKKLEHATREINIYDGPAVESRIWYVKQKHIQWPSTTSNLVFMVTLFCDTEYLWIS